MIKTPAFALIIALCIMNFAAFGSEDGNSLLKRIDANLNPESYEFYRKLINIEPDGKKKEFTLYAVKKGHDKVAALFLSPASERGRSTLRIGQNYWLYIPSVRKPIRITNVQSVTGGVFNNADILGIDYSAEYRVEELSDNGANWLFRLKAKNKSAAYDVLRMVVEKKSVLPVKIECMTEASMLIKTLYFKNIKNFGQGIMRPSIIETDSPLQEGYRSIMIFTEMRKRKLPDEVFTLNYMPRIEALQK